MARKQYEDEFEDVEEFEEFEEFEEVEDVEDDFIEDFEPVKNKKQKSKSKLSKGLKVGIAIGVIAVVVAIALVGIFVVYPYLNPPATGEVPETIAVSSVISKYGVAPSDAVAASVVYDLYSIINDDTLSDQYKAAATLLFATGNEIFVNQYAYFRNQFGNTDLGSNRGELIYQRTRRETTDMKYDTTIKYPINHNFNAMAVNFVRAATIRYVRDTGYYYRMEGKGFTYNEETGLVSLNSWTKGKSWNNPETPNNTTGCYSDMIKINAYVGNLGEDIASSTVYANNIDASSVVITKEADHFKVSFSIDIASANADSRTTQSLDDSNSGSGIKYDYCKVEYEVWNCGLTKFIHIEEKWNGKVQMFTGAADSVSDIYYSYDTEDCTNVEYPEEWINKIGI